MRNKYKMSNNEFERTKYIISVNNRIIHFFWPSLLDD